MNVCKMHVLLNVVWQSIKYIDVFKTQDKKQADTIKWAESLNVHQLKEYIKSTKLYEKCF